MNTFEKPLSQRSAHAAAELRPSPPPRLGDAVRQRLKIFNTFWDSRFEDLTSETWVKATYRDLSAGLIVALTAIPMAMGFAMAMGLRPEQGIIAGALACVIGRTWGGSKYQVYGPTAAFIPIIAALMQKYGEAGGGAFAEAHGFLVFVSLIAGIILMLMGVFGLGKYAKLVPNSIIVGFTVGIAVAIALTNLESVLGIESFEDLLGEDEDITGGLLHNLSLAFSNLDKINVWSVALGLTTFILTKGLLRISIFIPAPLLAIGASTWLAATVLADKGVILVRDVYGTIPNNFFVFTPPIVPELTASVMTDVVYFVAAIVFVSAVESLLCSSMADRMADNRKTPFNPDKEFWGQGLVQIVTPMMNGFPCTGALARTATSIKAGAVTPLAGYFKAAFKLGLAYYIAGYLELVPMACIGGILLWVASNMIKVSEIKEVLGHNRFHAGLMAFTAVMVPATDFLTGVLSALVIFFVGRRFFDKPAAQPKAIEKAALRAPGLASTPGRFKRVTVPLAMTENNEALLRYAAHLAELGICKDFHFVHVVTPNDKTGAAPVDPVDNFKRHAQAIFGPAYSRTAIDCQVLRGPNRIDAVVRHALSAKSDLILLHHRENTGGRRALARRLAMITHCSVWMLPGECATDIRRIVAPIDFSESSADSLSEAAALAKACRAESCSALHVFFDEAVVRYDEHDAIKRGEEAAAFARFAAPIDVHGVTVEAIFEESVHVARAILERVERERADLIVIGTRGHNAAAAVLLGGVTSQVMAKSPIPVLAVKHDGDRTPLRETLLASRFWLRRDPKTN